MAKTNLITIPSTDMTVGVHNFGPFNVATGKTQYDLEILQVGWPYTGGLAFSFSCDYSTDGGNTWIPSTLGDVDDLPIPSKWSRPANVIRIVCSIGGTGVRKVRLQSTWAKALTISGTISAA